MDFALSEEQQLLQDTIQEFLKTSCTLDQVRNCVDNEITSDPNLIRELTSLGVPGIVVPEEFGGTGLGYLEAALVAEALGGAVAPYPFIGTSVVSPFVIQAAGSDEQKAEWLPKIANGDLRFGIAFTERVGDRGKNRTTSTNGRISGSQTFVLDGGDADLILVITDEDSVYVVDSKEIKKEELRTIDRTRSFSAMKFHDTPGVLIPGSEGNCELLRDSISIARIMLAADTLGAAQKMLDQSVEYAKERKQFQRVIGSFQAVKHMCAEMAAELEPCRSLVWYAAHSVLSIPLESYLVACHAKAHLSEVGQFVARKATEVHGGMGFTDLLGLHYWFKRIGLNRQLLGTPDQVREEAALAQGW